MILNLILFLGLGGGIYLIIRTRMPAFNVSVLRARLSVLSTIEAIPFWFAFVHSSLLILGATRQWLLPGDGHFLGLFIIIDFPWSFFLMMIMGTTPGLSETWQISMAFFIGGIIYWYTIGLFIRLIARAIKSGNLQKAQRPASPSRQNIDNQHAVVCPVCGASNNPSFTVCWNCAYNLRQQADPANIAKHKVSNEFKANKLAFIVNYQNILSKASFQVGLTMLPPIVFVAVSMVFISALFTNTFLLRTLISFVISVFATGYWSNHVKDRLLRHGITISEPWLMTGVRLTLYSILPISILTLCLMVIGVICAGLVMLLPSQVQENFVVLSGVAKLIGYFVSVSADVLCKGVVLRGLYSE